MSSKKYEDELMAGSDEDSHDAYLEQMKAEGAERDEDDSESSEGLSTKRVFLLSFVDITTMIMIMIMIMIIFAFFINSIVNTEWLSKNHFVK